MKLKLIIGLALVLFLECHNDDKKVIPECLMPIIEVIQEQPVQSPKATIERWLYQDQEVYVIDAQHFPDGQAFVITTDCESICALGGIDGPANDCPNWEDAEFIETIWVDTR